MVGYAWLADLVMLLHLGFVLFVSVGVSLVYFRPRLAAIHLPCVAYGAAIELIGWTCPLTPLEQELRRSAGQGGYTGGFFEHYVGGFLYPANWGDVHVWLGIGLVTLNALVYAFLAFRLRRAPRTG